MFDYAVYDRADMTAVVEGAITPNACSYHEAVARAAQMTGRDLGTVRRLMPQCDKGNRRFYLAANGMQKKALRSGGVIVQRVA